MARLLAGRAFHQRRIPAHEKADRRLLPTADLADGRNRGDLGRPGLPAGHFALHGVDPELQAAIIKAGKEAGAYGRQIESSEDSAKLDALEKAGKLKRIAFTDRAEMKKLVDPVMAAYAKEIGADTIFGQINATK